MGSVKHSNYPMSKFNITAYQTIAAIEPVLEKLKKQYPQTYAKHCNIVLEIAVLAPKRIISVCFRGSVMFLLAAKNDKNIIIHYAPETNDSKEDKNELPFCLQLFDPQPKDIEFSDVGKLEQLLEQYQ